MHLAFSMYTLTIVSLWWLYDCYGYINQDNLKTYQRSLGRKLFISYEITLIIRFWIFIFSTCLFLIVCFYLFVSILWAISSFPLLFIYFFACVIFLIQFSLKESLTSIVDLAICLPNWLMDLLRNFLQKKFLNWSILLNVFFSVSHVTYSLLQLVSVLHCTSSVMHYQLLLENYKVYCYSFVCKAHLKKKEKKMQKMQKKAK